MHAIFDFNKVDFDRFFATQQGEGDFYRGKRYIRSYKQNGQGVGLVLSSLWRVLSPVLKNLGTNLGREALSTGSRILEDVTKGESIKDAAKSGLKQGVKNIFGPHKGEGRKRKLIGRRYLVKNSQRDIFGH